MKKIATLFTIAVSSAVLLCSCGNSSDITSMKNDIKSLQQEVAELKENGGYTPSSNEKTTESKFGSSKKAEPTEKPSKTTSTETPSRVVSNPTEEPKDTNSVQSSNSSSSSSSSNLLTLSKFNEVELGITIDELIEFLGIKPTSQDEFGEPGDLYYAKMYRYMGKSVIKGDMGANVQFSFDENGLLTSKSQSGLED